jgi:putative effector of murein hydrolase
MSKVQYFTLLVVVYFMLVALYYQVRHYTLRYPKLVKILLIVCFLGWGALLFDCIRDIMTSVVFKS